MTMIARGLVALLALLGILAPVAPTHAADDPAPPRFTNPVVFIPGILGSRLVDAAGTQIWGASLWKMRTHFHRLALPLTLHDDGIRPAGPVADILVFGQFLKLKQYSAMTDYLASLGLREQSGNLLVFSYDWRRSSREAALALKLSLDNWRAVHNWPDARFTVIAHSMGGLVAQYYITQLQGDAHVARLILLGTPSEGSLKALRMLTGHFDDELTTLLGRERLRDVLASLPSIYELLPRRRDCCFRLTASGQEVPIDLFEVTEWRRLGWRPFGRDEEKLWQHLTLMLKSAQDFHHSLARVEEKTKISKIAGFTQRTPERIVFDEAGREIVARTRDAPGDGTVTLRSAARGDVDDNLVLVAEKHGSLFADHMAKQQMLLLAADFARTRPEDLYSSAQVSDLGLRLADVSVSPTYVKRGQRVEVTVVIESSGGAVPGDVRVRIAYLGAPVPVSANPARGTRREFTGWLVAAQGPGTQEVAVTLSRVTAPAQTLEIHDFLEVIP